MQAEVGAGRSGRRVAPVGVPGASVDMFQEGGTGEAALVSVGVRAAKQHCGWSLVVEGWWWCGSQTELECTHFMAVMSAHTCGGVCVVQADVTWPMVLGS